MFAKFTRAVVAILAIGTAPIEARQSAASVNPQAYDNAIEAYSTGHELIETASALKVWTRNEAAVERLISEHTSAGVSNEGWHDIRVTLKGARGDVTARPGYFVAAQ